MVRSGRSDPPFPGIAPTQLQRITSQPRSRQHAAADRPEDGCVTLSAGSVFAPEGHRAVATGEVRRRQTEPVENEWNNQSAPAGRRERPRGAGPADLRPAEFVKKSNPPLGNAMFGCRTPPSDGRTCHSRRWGLEKFTNSLGRGDLGGQPPRVPSACGGLHPWLRSSAPLGPERARRKCHAVVARAFQFCSARPPSRASEGRKRPTRRSRAARRG